MFVCVCVCVCVTNEYVRVTLTQVCSRRAHEQMFVSIRVCVCVYVWLKHNSSKDTRVRTIQNHKSHISAMPHICLLVFLFPQHSARFLNTEDTKSHISAMPHICLPFFFFHTVLVF